MNHKFCRGKLLSLLERQCLKKLFKMVCLNKTTFFYLFFFTKVHRIFIQFWLVRSHNISTHFIAWSAFIHHHQPKRIDSAKNIKKQKKNKNIFTRTKGERIVPKDYRLQGTVWKTDGALNQNRNRYRKKKKKQSSQPTQRRLKPDR